MTNPTLNIPPGEGEKLQPAVQPAPPSPPRRKRLRRVLLIFAVALLVIIALVPRLLSTGIGRSIAIGQINGRIAGQANIDRLRLRWFGWCAVGGLRLHDLTGREVLRIDNVDIGQGLLSTILSGGDLEKVQAQNVQVAAYLAQDNTASLAAAVSLPENPGREYLVPAENLKDVLDVHAPVVQASWVGGKLQVHASDKITATRRADSARGVAQGEALHISKLDVDGADGTYQLAAEVDGDLGILTDVGLGWKGAEGTVTLSVEGTVRDGGTQLGFKTRLENARYPQTPDDTAAPINADITGKVALAGGQISGDVTLDGNIGSAKAEVRYNPPAQPEALQLDDVMSAVLTGAEVQLPDVTLTSSARLDVAMILRAAPSALRVRPGLTVTGGELRINDLEVRGGDAASIKGGVELTALSADDKGKKIELTPLTAQIDAHIKRGEGLEFREAHLKSSYAEINAQGSAANLRAGYEADLTQMRQQLAQLFELPVSELSGKVSGQVAVTRTSDTHAGVTLAAKADQLGVGAGEKRLQLERASISAEGQVALKEGKVVKISAERSQLNIDDKVVGEATGWYDFASEGFDGKIDFERIEVPHVAAKLAAFGIAGLESLSGDMALHAGAARPSGDAAIVSDGNLVGRELRRDGQLLSGKEIAIHWSKAQYEPKAQRVAAEFKADVDGKIAAVGSGWYEVPGGLFDAKLDVQQVDPAFAGTLADAFGIPQLNRYSGNAKLQADAKRSTAEGMITCNGTVTAREVHIDGEEVAPGETVAQWSDLHIEPGKKDFSAKLVQLDSALVHLTAKDVSLKLQGEPTAIGRITCNAGLAGTLNAIGRAARWEKIPAIAGQLSFDGRCETAGGVVGVQGDGKIIDLVVGSGEQAVKEKQVTFGYQANFDRPKDTLNLQQVKLASQGLSAEMSGQISRLTSSRILALGGSYDASWEHVTTLLHEVVPSTVEMVALAGQKRSEFKLSGPLSGEGEPRRAGVSPQLTGDMGLGWASVRIAGLSLGPADLKTTLRESRIEIPQTQIAASGGSVNVGGAVDLQSQDPTLRIPGTVQLIDKVTVDPAIAQSLLARINPIFVNMTSVEGQVSVRTQDLVLPFGEAFKTSSQGRGFLDLTNLKVQPTGLLAELLRLGGPAQPAQPGEKESDKQTIQVSGVDFEIKDGRFVYQNFTMTFPDGFDLRFYGSVGFDDTLDLVVSIPVRQELLDRLKVGGDVGKVLGALGAARVDIPIVGTRQKPKLDLSAIDITKLLRPDEGLIPRISDILGGPPKAGSGQGDQDKSPPPEPEKKRRSPKRRSGR